MLKSVVAAIVLALVAIFASTTITPARAADSVANCQGFSSQAAAQAALRANPSDPNNLDADNDGIACEHLACPCDLTPVYPSSIYNDCYNNYLNCNCNGNSSCNGCYYYAANCSVYNNCYVYSNCNCTTSANCS